MRFERNPSLLFRKHRRNARVARLPSVNLVAKYDSMMQDNTIFSSRRCKQKDIGVPDGEEVPSNACNAINSGLRLLHLGTETAFENANLVHQHIHRALRNTCHFESTVQA
jgi:hypothetical protein